jgi:hypothetical protein
MPGTISASIPAAAASSRKRKKQSGEKKNWVIARSAPASTLRLRFSRSNARVDESGGISGSAATEISNGATRLRPATSSIASR